MADEEKYEITTHSRAVRGEVTRKPFTGIGASIADMTSEELDEYVEKLYQMEQRAGMENSRDDIYARLADLRDQQQRATDAVEPLRARERPALTQNDDFVDPRAGVKDPRHD